MQKFSKLLCSFKTSDKICIRNKWRMSQHKREEIVFFELSVIYFLTTKMCDIITVVVWVKLGIPKALPYTFEASKSWIFLTKNVGMFFSQNVGSSLRTCISNRKFRTYRNLYKKQSILNIVSKFDTVLAIFRKKSKFKLLNSNLKHLI